MRPWLAIAALALPLAGLSAAIAVREARLQGAEPWVIPIAGFDPRDPLRGRYVRFEYRWAVAGDAKLCNTPPGCQLCLSRAGAQVNAAITPRGATCPSRVDPAASNILVTPAIGGGPPRFTSRIFVSESSAPALETQLRRGPMRVRAVLTREGRLVVRDLIPPG